MLDFEDYEARMHKLLRRQYGETLTLAGGAAPAKVSIGRIRLPPPAIR